MANLKIKNRKHAGEIIDRKDGRSVIACQICCFKHVWPLPSARELERLYKKEYYSQDKSRYLQEAALDRQWWMLTYHNYYSLLEQKISGRQLLDIGSGPGYFLKAGQERGWDTLGFEPSPQAFLFATEKLKVKVINDFFNQKAAKGFGPFDVINLSMILEHIPNPFGLIQTAKKFLKPKGLLAVFCPNDYNSWQKILREKMGFAPWWVLPHHHLNYFDFASAAGLLQRSGFKIVETVGTFPMEWFLLSGDDYIGRNQVGRRCHARRKRFEINLYKHQPVLLNEIYRSLARLGVGREFFIIGQKK